ncbi:hypothetical protein GCM10009808_09930 [Microbacterium sediminicola]|uniref:Response regulatory domain-containing protein n=1 Tax=Microbacterium sediminicola TaxID=415210 RepID=A0ABN2HWS9_9MICO
MAEILVVEDDSDVAHLLNVRLTRGGHDVSLAADGAAGLTAARAGHPDLVILDWMMPLKNGLEVCTELRASEDFSATKIMMLTARTTQEDIDRAMAAGADDFVTKPFSPRALVERVEKLIA